MAPGLYLHYNVSVLDMQTSFLPSSPPVIGHRMADGEQVNRQEVGSGDWQSRKLADGNYWTVDGNPHRHLMFQSLESQMDFSESGSSRLRVTMIYTQGAQVTQDA